MLTTLTLVKARLGLPDADVKDDDLLTQIIALVSARFENECNRKFGYASQVDEFEGDETELRVSRYPIDSNVAITFDLKSGESTGWMAQTNFDYVVRMGTVISLAGMLGRDKDVLRVTYSGGYLLPDGGAGSVALPDDLTTQATEQCVFIYQNKDRVGIKSMSSQGGSINIDNLDLLASARAVIAKHERWMP
jgi:hypothetical protein